jgi:hypothetical protein
MFVQANRTNSERNYMKKIIAGITIALMAFVTTGVASAASISNVNDSSLASIVNDWMASLTLANINHACISNEVSSTANSGGNTATSVDDQTNTTINTGGANSASMVDNAANQNQNTESVESSNSSGDTITNVGDDSTATTTTSDTVTSTETETNAVGVRNDVAADSQTGNNIVTSGDSLTGTSLSSGLAQAMTGVANSFNINIRSITRTLRSF